MLQQKSYQAQHRDAHLAPAKGPDAPKWYVVDATDQVVGRLATTVADVLRGKHKPTWTRHADAGDFVIVTNAKNLVFTRNKMDDKLYYDHSGYVGGLKTRTAREIVEKNPAEIIERAVKGMLGRSILARRQLKKLKIFNGAEHDHASQQPGALPQHVLKKSAMRQKSQ